MKNMALIEGRLAPLTFLAMIVFIALYLITRFQRLAREGKELPKIRKLAAIDAIEEAVGRCAEMGAPIHFYDPGTNQIATKDSPALIAGVSILGYAARLAARYDTKIIQSLVNPQGGVLVEEKLKEAFILEGKEDQWDPLYTIRYLAGSLHANNANVLGMFERERPAANILVGWINAPASTPICEGAARLGMFQIGGINRTYDLPNIITTCDYIMMGEELYAAGAWITKSPVMVGNVIASDYIRFVFIGITLIGFILVNAGIDIVKVMLSS